MTHESPDSDQIPGGSPAGFFAPPQRPSYRPRWWLHWTLFLLTFIFTTFWGGLFFGWGTEHVTMLRALFFNYLHPSIGIALLTDRSFIVEGLKFSIPMLTILFAHEMGHYIACRRHNLEATPPFFIPAPFGIGTFGAVIRIREPIRNKHQLMDVGAAGPIAGFIALLPFLVAGVALSRPTDVSLDGAETLGEPLVFRIVELITSPQIAEGQDLIIHPMGGAAWVGILITLLNLLPFAQLDGGHITYALFGRWHRKAAIPALLLLVAIGFWWPGWWFWAVIAVFMRVHHPRIWDEDQPLDPRRRLVGWIAIAIFVLCFMLEPIAFVG